MNLKLTFSASSASVRAAAWSSESQAMAKNTFRSV